MEAKFKKIQIMVFVITILILFGIWGINGYDNTWLYVTAAIVAIPTSWYFTGKRNTDRVPILYIMVGVGFSGKSTLSKKIAEHTHAIRISQDEVWVENQEALNLEKDSAEQWRMIVRLCEQKITEELKKGNSVVFDNTNLKRSYRDILRQLASSVGAVAKVIYLDTSEDVQRARQEANKLSGDRHDVEQVWLDKAKKELEIPTAEEGAFFYTPDGDIQKFLYTLK